MRAASSSGTWGNVPCILCSTKEPQTPGQFLAHKKCLIHIEVFMKSFNAFKRRWPGEDRGIDTEKTLQAKSSERSHFQRDLGRRFISWNPNSSQWNRNQPPYLLYITRPGLAQKNRRKIRVQMREPDSQSWICHTWPWPPGQVTSPQSLKWSVSDKIISPIISKSISSFF